MGACLSSLCSADGDGPRDISRRKSRGGSAHGRQDYYGNSARRPAPPDFGVSSVFLVMELLGEGGTGTTYLCQDLKSARRVAIKFMPRPLAKVLIPMVSQEIQLQARLSEGHIGLVRVESALLSRTHLGLVMEYIDGGTLTQYVTKRAHTRGERGGLHLTEDEARYFFRQLISAVEYLHKSQVAHRDLKMCNVVLTQRRPPTLKLCDFGFAKGWDDSSIMNTRIGTPVYMSPQLIASKNEGKAYSATAADVWACGVMLFAMLLGRFPYDHLDHPDPNSSGAHLEVWNEQMKAMDGDWATSPRVAPHIMLLTEECKDLLGKMLCREESGRITIPEIRNHPWFTTILPPYLADALQDFEERQARLCRVMEGACEMQLKRRNKAVHDLIVMAGQPGTGPGATGVKPKIPASHISAIFEGVEGDGASVTSSKPPTLGISTPAKASPAAKLGSDKSVRGGDKSVRGGDKSVRGGDKSVRGGGASKADGDKSVRGGTRGLERCPTGLERMAVDAEKSVRGGVRGLERVMSDGDRSVRGATAGLEKAGPPAAAAAMADADADRSVRGGRARGLDRVMSDGEMGILGGWAKGLEGALTAVAAAVAPVDGDRSSWGRGREKEKEKEKEKAQGDGRDKEKNKEDGKDKEKGKDKEREAEEEPGLVYRDQDVIIIELAAVARRTKSDGLLLSNAYAGPTLNDGLEISRNCDSDDTDPSPERSSPREGSHPVPHPQAQVQNGSVTSANAPPRAAEPVAAAPVAVTAMATSGPIVTPFAAAAAQAPSGGTSLGEKPDSTCTPAVEAASAAQVGEKDAVGQDSMGGSAPLEPRPETPTPTVRVVLAALDAAATVPAEPDVQAAGATTTTEPDAQAAGATTTTEPDVQAEAKDGIIDDTKKQQQEEEEEKVVDPGQVIISEPAAATVNPSEAAAVDASPFKPAAADATPCEPDMAVTSSSERAAAVTSSFDTAPAVAALFEVTAAGPTPSEAAAADAPPSEAGGVESPR